MKRFQPRRSLKNIAAAAALLTAAATHAHGDKHEHGVVRLDVSVDGQSLLVQLESPLDSVLGFERRPRTDAEKQAVSAMLAKLRKGAELFKAPDAARCQLQDVQLVSALIQESGAESTGRAASGSEQDHLDVEATYHFSCQVPAALVSISHSLFASFPRIQRIEAQTAGPRGQGKQVLRRHQTTVKIGK